MISQIEMGKSRPSVSTLYALTTALGLSLEDVFTHAAALPVVASTAAGAEGASDLALPLPAAHRLGPLVRPPERPCLTLDTGVTWERLGQLPHHNTDFLLITYPPGATSSSTAGLMRHSGAEYGYVLSGELTLTLAFDDIRLQPGDSISFESATPHRYRNDGSEDAVGVWFVIEDA
jgi:quercetin dioxygenase-like cupin family protein/DNA-binding XRE family transcriptional regulator